MLLELGWRQLQRNPRVVDASGDIILFDVVTVPMLRQQRAAAATAAVTRPVTSAGADSAGPPPRRFQATKFNDGLPCGVLRKHNAELASGVLRLGSCSGVFVRCQFGPHP